MAALDAFFSGSSLQRRGTRAAGLHAAALGRFIPAEAGNTNTSLSCWACSSVHPRRGGEHSSTMKSMLSSSGSSPQRRGTRVQRFFQLVGQRFIPAEAGNTSAYKIYGLDASVHPRRGGEHDDVQFLNVIDAGSSPQRRGTRWIKRLNMPKRRFIPAEVGNTLPPLWPAPPLPVHPRRGGEHPTYPAAGYGQPGSSPQRRGTHRKPGEHQAECRFIPAEAGNTRKPGAFTPRPPVHPRRGGEHARPKERPAPFSGSSPQRRGTQPSWDIQHRRPRFIPAEAGNTQLKRGAAPRISVHPRRGGEHLQAGDADFVVAGSSPQRRGTQRCLALYYLH